MMPINLYVYIYILVVAWGYYFITDQKQRNRFIWLILLMENLYGKVNIK